MRSLLLTASFPPALGGIETLLYQTSRRLEEPPLVLAPAPAAVLDLAVHAVRTDLMQKLLYRPLWGLHPSLHYVHALWAPAVRAVRTYRPAVIQAGHVSVAPLAWLLARRARKPFVVYAYGQEVWRGGRAMGGRALDDKLRGGSLRAADRILVPGEFTANLLCQDWGVASHNLVYVPYGAEPRPAGGPPTGKRLLTVARLVPRKGIDTVIRALRDLPSDVEYRIVGSGPDHGRLQALAHAERVATRVRFLGRLDDAALAHEYENCTIFVLPARRTAQGELEGYGLVYFEAAAWGRPVVAGRSGGEIDSVVDGETGVLVDGESVSDVARTIAELLRNPARIAALGAAGRRRVETTHNWSQAAFVVDRTLVALA